MQGKQNLPCFKNKYKLKSVKRLSILLVFLVFLFSCSSTSMDLDSDGNTSSSSEDEIVSALTLLLSDTFSLTKENISIAKEEIADAAGNLDQYENYLPRFDELKESYLSSLSDLAENAARDAIDYLESLNIVISSNSRSFINDRTLSSFLRSSIKENVRMHIVSYLRSNSSEARAIYDAIKTECDIINVNMENLRKVGADLYLPRFEFISYSSFADMVFNILFDRLEENEMILKNRPLDEDTDPLYRVFWSY